MITNFLTTLTVLSSLTQTLADIQITAVNDHVFAAAASPVWHNETQSIYLCDINTPDSMINRFDYRTKEHFGAKVIGVDFPTIIVPVEGVPNQFLISSERSMKRIYWDGRSPTANVIDTLFDAETDPAYSANILHFGKVDPENRFYFGTARITFCRDDNPAPAGSFYVYTKEQGIRRITGVEAVAGGMAWNVEKKIFYGVDDCSNDVFQYSYTDDGTYYDRQQLFHIPMPPNYTDARLGNTALDGNGNLWTYLYNGSAIFQLDLENRRILRELPFSVPTVAGLAFGGPNRDKLFVATSARTIAPAVAIIKTVDAPLAGRLFEVTGLETTGAPSWPYRL